MAADLAELPLVSVVIPTFNSARWVEETLASVRAQDYPRLEVIVVDNGSTDTSVAVTRAVAPDAVLIAAPRLPGTLSRGAAVARNAGLAAAHGAFVQFLDSDDLLGPQKISRQVEVASHTGADVVWSGFHDIGPEATLQQLSPGNYHEPVLDAADIPRSIIGPGGFLQLGAALFRREGVNAKVRFDSSPGTIEDVRYVIDVGFAGARFVRGEDAGLYWRQHDSSLRVSRRDEAEFARAVYNQAAYVLARWMRSGALLTTERVMTVSGVWLWTAEVLEEKNDPFLETVLRSLAELDPDWHRRVRSPHKWLVPLLGYRQTFALARGMKGVLRGRRRADAPAISA